MKQEILIIGSTDVGDYISRTLNVEGYENFYIHALTKNGIERRLDERYPEDSPAVIIAISDPLTYNKDMTANDLFDRYEDSINVLLTNSPHTSDVSEDVIKIDNSFIIVSSIERKIRESLGI